MAAKNDLEKSEKIGFHKGSLATLTKEREELARMLSIVEQLMHMHIKELKEVGVDLAAEAKKASSGKTTKKLKGKKDLGEIL